MGLKLLSAIHGMSALGGFTVLILNKFNTFQGFIVDYGTMYFLGQYISNELNNKVIFRPMQRHYLQNHETHFKMNLSFYMERHCFCYSYRFVLGLDWINKAL